MKNIIIVGNDFDGFFEAEAKRIAEELPQDGITLSITAIPFASCDVDVFVNPLNTKFVNLTYYSAVRAGFGSLHHKDVIDYILERL